MTRRTKTTQTAETRACAETRAASIFTGRSSRVVWFLQVGLVFLAGWTAWLQLGCSGLEQTKNWENTVRRSADLGRRGSLLTHDGLVLAHDLPSWRVGIDPIALWTAVSARESVQPVDRLAIARDELRSALADFPWDLLDRRRSSHEVLELALESLASVSGAANGRRLRYVHLGEIHDETRLRPVSRWRAERRRETGVFCFNIDRFQRRDYPQRQLASQVVGEVGREGYGLWGLELVWEQELACRDGVARSRRAGGRWLADLSAGGVPRTDGTDVVLTLDSRAQQMLEENLLLTHDEWQAERTIGIVMDPRSGAVRALASTPLLDRQRLSELRGESRMNEIKRSGQCLSSYQFEPGSVIKSFVLSQVYLQGLDPTEIVTDGHKSWRYRGRTITDSSTHGKLDIEESVVHSSNIGLARVGLKLGGARLRECMRRFGFGQRTHVGLDAWEWKGTVTSVKDWTYYSTTGIPYGYEVSATVPQIARAYCALINGGYEVQPHLVETVRSPTGQDLPAPTAARALERRRQVFPARGEAISARVRGVLRKAVEEGTGRDLDTPYYGRSIGLAGKTGTAKISGKFPDGTFGYEDGAYRSTFVGFAPYDDPEYVVVVVVVRPQGAHYGAKVAGPAVRRVLGGLLGSPDPELGQHLEDLLSPQPDDLMYDREAGR